MDLAISGPTLARSDGRVHYDMLDQHRDACLLWPVPRFLRESGRGPNLRQVVNHLCNCVDHDGVNRLPTSLNNTTVPPRLAASLGETTGVGRTVDKTRHSNAQTVAQ